MAPQYISGNESVDFSMRVAAPDLNRQVVFRSGGQTLRKMKENVLAPSSMIRLRVRAERLQKINGELTVEIEA